MNDLAKKFVIPSPYGDEFRCQLCRHYLDSQEKTVAIVMTPQGPQTIPYEAAVQQGLPIGSYIKTEMAFCVEGPVWQQVARMHWCHRFEAARQN